MRHKGIKQNMPCLDMEMNRLTQIQGRPPATTCTLILLILLINPEMWPNNRNDAVIENIGHVYSLQD